MNNKNLFIISLGGSIIVPAPGKINTSFLKKFRKLILGFIRQGRKFIIVTGGGKICRTYQNAASEIIRVPSEDKDWIGIHVTRLNAHLLRTIFRNEASPIVMDSPFKKIKKEFLKKPIIIASGWRPGWSTDYIAILLAKRFGTKEIINASNIPFLYEKDINHYKKAKKILKISWSNYQKLIGRKWIPGLSVPVDPIAAREAKKSNIRVIIVKGTDLENFKKIFKKKKFRGTIIL